MKLIGNWIKNNPIRTLFLIPIILVAAISISHVVTWYSIANPINWAIYLSIAIEVGAMTALVAATNKVKGGVWFMFGLVTFIQMVGNIYFSFKEIDTSGELWLSWIELTTPVWEMVGTELTDTLALKRWLAFLEGGLLPIISLTSLHFFVRYDRNQNEELDKEKIMKEYFDARNQKMVDIVESSKEYNPMTEHPEDVYYPEKKVEEDETEFILKSKANKEHLEKSIEQSKEIEKKIDEKDIYGERDEDPKEEEIKLENIVSEEDKEVKEVKEAEILKKAMNEYQNKQDDTTEKKNTRKKLINTEYGKVTAKSNIKRID